MKTTKRLILLAALAAGCAAPPAPPESPLVRVTCFVSRPPTSAIFTREQFRRVLFQNLPCLFEELDAMPVPPTPRAPVPSPTVPKGAKK